MSKYGVISGPYFPIFGLNTEKYSISLRIQSEYRKIRTRNNSVFGYFLCSVRKYKQINFFPHKMITKPMVFWWFQGTEVSWLIRSNLFNICSGIWERSLTWRLIWNDTKVLIIQKNQNVSGSSSCKSWRRAKMLPKVGQVIPG